MAVVLDTPGADIWQDGLLARMTSPHDQLRLLLRLRPLIQGRMLAKVLQFTERLSGGEAINSLCCATFWSVDPAFGWCLQNMLSVLVSAVAIAKVAFRGPRPMWLSGSVRLTDKVLQESLTAYGFPSGHVTGAIVFYGLVFATKAPVSTPAKCAAVTSVATCVGLARMLAMAHLPVDVIGAVPLGLLVLPPCIHFTQRYLKKPKTKHDPVRPSKRIASANLAVGCALLLVALRLLNPRHTRWASKDLTLAIGITIATGLSHLMLLTQRGLKFYPHHGELSIGTRASRLALGLLGQLAGYGVLKVARSRSLVSTPWVSEVALIPAIYGCIHSWGAWVVPSLMPGTVPKKPVDPLKLSYDKEIQSKDVQIARLEELLSKATTPGASPEAGSAAWVAVPPPLVV